MRGVINLLAAALLLAPLTACGSSSSPTTPINPTTETFTGTIAHAAGTTQTFNTTTSGTVTATLTITAPLSTLQVGFVLGTWDATANTCQTVLVNTAATTGSQLMANASTKGTYCVYLYDVGNISADTPASFSLSVTHP